MCDQRKILRQNPNDPKLSANSFTFWPGNSICKSFWRLWLQIGHLRTLTPPIYPEFPCASAEHSGLACGAIFQKQEQRVFSKAVHLYRNNVPKESKAVNVCNQMPSISRITDYCSRQISKLSKVKENVGDYVCRIISLLTKLDIPDETDPSTPSSQYQRMIFEMLL